MLQFSAIFNWQERCAQWLWLLQIPSCWAVLWCHLIFTELGTLPWKSSEQRGGEHLGFPILSPIFGQKWQSSEEHSPSEYWESFLRLAWGWQWDSSLEFNTEKWVKKRTFHGFLKVPKVFAPLTNPQVHVICRSYPSCSLGFEVNLILACFKRIHCFCRCKSGSTLLQCSLPIKTLARTTLRWVCAWSLGQNWKNTSPEQHLCHPISQSLGQNFSFHSCGWPWGVAAAHPFLGRDEWLWNYCTPGEGGALKLWDLPLLGRARTKISFPCSGEAQKAVGIPGFRDPSSGGVWKHLPWPSILPGAVLPKEHHQELRFLSEFTKTFPESRGLSQHCPLGGHCAPKDTKGNGTTAKFGVNPPRRAWTCRDQPQCSLPVSTAQ